MKYFLIGLLSILTLPITFPIIMIICSYIAISFVGKQSVVILKSFKDING